jgi:adenylate cyclase
MCNSIDRASILMQLSRHHLTRRDLRLGSGLILFAYVAAHFVNHALGLISVAVAERGLRVAVAVWHNPLGTALLYGAACIHITLAFVALYEHRTLRIPPLEFIRIALGFGIPTLLIAHIVTTRLAFELQGAQADYAHVVWMLWHSNREGRQMALLVPGWLHGCLGLNFAFGQRAWFQRLRLLLFGVALLVPILATLGFLEMLKEVSTRAGDPAWLGANVSAQMGKLAWVSDLLLGLYIALIVAVFVARMVRRTIEGFRGALVSITYPGHIVRVPRGWSVLEASRSHHIPHLSTCGGRARCSTCRVRIVTGADQCPPPARDELDTLERIHASEDTRLACQLRPQGNITVIPLEVATSPSMPKRANASVEREIAVMVVGFRWTAISHTLLPHDHLYLLGRYSGIVGDVVREEHGVPIQFSADGVTAVFGLEVGAKEANRQALAAAARVDRRLHALSDRLKRDLGWAMDHVIDLHTGSAGVGETGDTARPTLAAVGKTLDVVRQLAARHDEGAMARIVLSEAVMIAAGLDTGGVDWREFALPDEARLKVTSIA